jgi:hypothetical protein
MHFRILPMYAVLQDAELTIHFCVLLCVLCFLTTELPWLGMEIGIGSGLNLFYCVGLDCFVFIFLILSLLLLWRLIDGLYPLVYRSYHGL